MRTHLADGDRDLGLRGRNAYERYASLKCDLSVHSMGKWSAMTLTGVCVAVGTATGLASGPVFCSFLGGSREEDAPLLWSWDAKGRFAGTF